MFAGASSFSSASPGGARTTSWNMATMLKTSGIPSEVQQHLVRVYAILTACVASAALGCAGSLLLGPSSLQARVDSASSLSLFSVLVTVGGAVWLHAEPLHHFAKRLTILLAIAATTGMSLSALVALSLEIDPTILITAFLATTTVFLCFTASAMLATRRSFLYLGGMLSSALSLLALASFANYFFRSAAFHALHLYAGLAIFCGYVIFDTQVIIEKALMGDKDAISHALDLFLDFVGIFVRVLVVLMEQTNKKKQREDREERRR